MLSYGFRLRRGEDDDLIAWIAEQPNKSEAIRESLRRGIAAAPPPAGDDHLLLRTVVVEAVREALAVMAIAVQPDQSGNGREAEDPELAARLDNLFEEPITTR